MKLPMLKMEAIGINLGLPPGWEAEVDSGGGSAEEGSVEVRTPRVHLGNFQLPPNRGDFGSGAVERMVSGDVLICLLEESPGVIGSGLYKAEGMPTIRLSDFAPEGMQRPIRGQSGAQKFFHIDGRAFALYIVMGSHISRTSFIEEVNNVLGAIELT
jgi:hypothetical protein